MKRIFLALLTTLMLVIPAYAAESGDDTVMDQPIQQEPVVVGTLEELQAAVDAAEDGDTIYLDCTISMKDGDMLITAKDITLIRSSRLENMGGRMIELYGTGTISGFTFIESGISHATIYSRAEGNGEILIENCTFKAAGDNGVEMFIRANRGDTLTVSNCTFYCGNGYVLYADFDTNVIVDSCTFQKGNYYAWFMIASYGDMTIEGCTFGAGTGYITASLDGEVTISNCEMAENYFKDRIYPNIYLESQISGAGKINILDEPIEGEGFYDLFTGEKVELPIKQDDLSALSYMTDEQAEIYFSMEEHIGQFDIKVDERNNHFDESEEFPDQQPDPEQPEQPQPPQQPGDQTGDDDSTGGEQPPQEPTQPPETNPDDGEQGQPQEPEQPPKDDPAEQPTEPEQPPEGEGKDDPTEPPPEAPEQPVEPPQDDTLDAPTTPQQPQNPANGNNGNNDNYTPPTDYYPVYRPLWPVVTVKPTEDSKPQTQPDNTPAPTKPQLVCNGAVIDTSRTVVLLGYEDGLLHEDDPLTRAQLATIIYRLLDDESIAKYSNAELAFVDVAADAWYAPYVQTINGAGIVQGVGGGRYDPNGIVSWSQIVTILTRFVEPQEYTLQHIQYQGWAEQAIQTAVANGWIADRADFIPDAIISRGQLEQLINSVLVLYR